MVGKPSRRYGSGQKILPEFCHWSETLPEVWNWSGDPLGGTEVVGRPSRRTGNCRRQSRMCGTGRESIPEVLKWSGDPFGGPEVVVDPPGGVELVGRPSRRSRSGRRQSRRSGTSKETLPEVRNWSRDPPGGLEVVGDPLGGPDVVGIPSWRSGSSRRLSRRRGTGPETLSVVRKWSGNIPRGPALVREPSAGVELVGRPSQRSGTGRENPRRSETGR